MNAKPKLRRCSSSGVKQKRGLRREDVNIDPDKDGVVLTTVKRIKFLPTPSQLRQGRKAPQTADEGVTLRRASPHHRRPAFVRAKISWQKSLEIEGAESSRWWWTTR